MTLSLLQYRDGAGRGVAFIRDGAPPRRLVGATDTLSLACTARARGVPLVKLVESLETGEALGLDSVELLPPIDHPDPAHVLLSGTGLTHLGSAEQRDRMHRAMSDRCGPQTDSMKMFLMGVEGGKPGAGARGVQPEWFYKGDGRSLVAPGAPLLKPDFALDAGEEPEIAGIYFVDDAGVPVRIGFALANEFSDHVTERHNYLWLAHSKLRTAALGAELLVTPLPDDISGRSRILRGSSELWSRPFLSGEANMSHSIANLEYHHFKYEGFRQPGDVHVHFFGTGTLSFGDDIVTREGDVFEIHAPPFTLPLRNPLAIRASGPIEVATL